jgi:PhnB protein
MTTTPVIHLNFTGRARAALEFYAQAFDGQAVVRTYAEVGMPADVPGADDIVWGQVIGADGFRLMAYDVPRLSDPMPEGSTRRENGATLTDQPFFISLSAADLAAATVNWERLAEGATVVEPLAASAWSAGFGMLTDRFGVTWVIGVDQA